MKIVVAVIKMMMMYRKPADRSFPHTLRHSFALAYIENGGDPFSLQRILGYTDQTTTSKYVNMARSNVKAQHSKYSPGERLG